MNTCLTKTLKQISWVIFVAGIVLALGQYLISNCHRFGWVERCVMPRYANATVALDKIDSFQTLTKQDRGAEEIEKILKAHLIAVPTNKDQTNILTEAHLETLKHTTTSVDFDGTKVVLSGQLSHPDKPIKFNNLDRSVLKDGVDKLRDKTLLPFSDWLFWLGLGLIVLSKAADAVIAVSDKKEKSNQ